MLCTDDKFFCRRPISISMEEKNTSCHNDAFSCCICSMSNHLLRWCACIGAEVYHRCCSCCYCHCIVKTNFPMKFTFYIYLPAPKMINGHFIQIRKLFTMQYCVIFLFFILFQRIQTMYVAQDL